MGVDTEFVNYINKNDIGQNTLIVNNPASSRKKNIIATAENIFLWRYFNNKRSFDRFHRELPCSKRVRDRKQLDQLTYDILVSGSDQLWNPDIFNGIDDVYFLNFGEAKLRISYAASAGSHLFNDTEKRNIQEWLSRYDSISVREDTLKAQIEPLTEKPVQLVADPTFLLKAEEWRELSRKNPFKAKGKYILLYMIGVPYAEYKKKYASVVRYYSKLLNLPVYAVNPTSFIPVSGATKNLTGIDPFEFLTYIDNAELILTSSYHGIAFSLNFNKRFVALKNSNPVRIQQILDMCQLSDRFIDLYDETVLDWLLEAPCFDTANKAIASIRESSMKWLETAVFDQGR